MSRGNRDKGQQQLADGDDDDAEWIADGKPAFPPHPSLQSLGLRSHDVLDLSLVTVLLNFLCCLN